ncbi:hypothetical protein AB0N09_32780 [Streptomyces erythrochromogenes]|uniref:hypothetical protein n=1 Tax=Streptomyces erythrochromogenes TaxID=285574 RepID=UPI003417844D
MRKALTLSAVAVAAAVTLGAPAAAFAADAPAAATSASPSAPAQDLLVSVQEPSVPAGGTIHVTFSGPQLKDATLTSSHNVLTNVNVDAGAGTATGEVKAGTAADKYEVTVKGTVDGKTVQASAPFEVAAATPGVPASSGTLTVTPDIATQGAQAGATVSATVQLKLNAGTAPQSVKAVSKAFAGGTVELNKSDQGDIWMNKVLIDGKVKPGTYDVLAYNSSKDALPPLAVAKLTVTGPKSHTPVTPPAPGKHVVPKGSVDTGMAPVAASTGTADATAAGIGAAGAAALLGMTLRKRRGNGA